MGVWAKDAKMESESASEEEIVAAPILAKIKAKVGAASKVTKKAIKK